MRRAAAAFAAAAVLAAATASAEEPRELIGQLGHRATLLVLYGTDAPGGAARLTGEYVLLGTLQRRFLEGERSPELGVTTLKESTSPILFGRPATGSLQGMWKDGAFRGTRYGPGGQERERFEFSETFPSLARYGATVNCEAKEGAYGAALAYVIEGGRLQPGSFSWTARESRSGHVCVLGGTRIAQAPAGAGKAGALRFRIGPESEGCEVAMRDLGEAVRVTATGCGAHCGSQAFLEPVLVDKRGACQLLRPQPR